MTACPSRRALLAGAATTLLAPGWLLVAAQAAVPTGRRWGLLIDTSKCTAGCDACVRACAAEYGWGDATQVRSDQAPRWIRKVEAKDPRSGAVKSLPVMCQHCAKPPCVDVCPTGASFKRADGIVLVDRHVCIGCRFCMMACPFGARSFVHEAVTGQRASAPRGMGTVEACHLCVGRVDAGLLPVCLEACRSEGRAAILFGDLNDPDSAIARRIAEIAPARLRPDLRVEPGVHYGGL
ncbi:MAG TPA: 4Fe-4S dicluster domain-containing protein [Azospirillum sp.]|nr:4Fe-4S dicluster domain-containing protein [Azospirillum sp.]